MNTLDFSGLMNISDKQDAPMKINDTPNKPNTSVKQPTGANVTDAQLNRLQRKYNAIQDTYKDLAETRKDTSSLKVALIHDINAGNKDIKDLLIASLELISVATRDEAFTNQTLRKLEENY